MANSPGHVSQLDNFRLHNIELMSVMTVTAVLATLALVGFRIAQQAARDAERQAIVRGIQTGLECYIGDHGQYPATINWGNPATQLNTGGTICWPGGGVTDPHGETGGQNPWTPFGTVRYNYGTAANNTAYTITLTGERRTFSFNSPQ